MKTIQGWKNLKKSNIQWALGGSWQRFGIGISVWYHKSRSNGKDNIVAKLDVDFLFFWAMLEYNNWRLDTEFVEW